MEIFIKTYENKLVKILDTSFYKRTKFAVTNSKNSQDKAKIEFFANDKKIKAITLKNLPPASAKILEISFILDVLDPNTLSIGYFYNNKNNECLIDLNKHSFDIKKFFVILSLIFGLAFFSILIYYLINNYNKLNSLFTQNNSSSTSTGETKISSIDKNIISSSTSSNELSADSSSSHKSSKSLYTIDKLKYVIEQYTPLYFIYDTTELLEGETAKLDAIADYLKNYKKVEILISGHAHKVGKNDKEMTLSINRANLIKDLLQEKLKNKDFTFTTKGYGSTKILTQEDSPEAEQYKNRRVEFEVIKAE